ncbi:hypothetical protein KO493_06015 [Tamlana agarivorans]|uniref:Uncharacterized protein n=1 Tax=Pseudotamlana agarivorans TaxID=481183 RepID=A0ACC5U7F4_9FLAO|nr:sulfotransferase [Tamlana agarivorans]MBU2950244.1 hypothetical protein [Tamlana agarivorans]
MKNVIYVSKKIIKASKNEIFIIKNILFTYFRKSNYNSKVFCIGYNKTGTTTLGKSLEMLGYKNSSFNRRIYRKYYLTKNYSKILKYTAKFESFDDLPWLKEDMIPILDKTFPESKFIYLTRDENEWKKSFYNWTYKVKGHYPDIEKGWEDYKNHEKFVLDYFKTHPKKDFIILNVKDKYGFEKLALFLGKESFRKSFPRFNESSN